MFIFGFSPFCLLWLCKAFNCLNTFRLSCCLECLSKQRKKTDRALLQGLSFDFYVSDVTFSCSLTKCGRLVGVTFHSSRQMVLSVDENVLSAGLVMATGSINHRVSRSHVNSLTWRRRSWRFRNKQFCFLLYQNISKKDKNALLKFVC